VKRRGWTRDEKRLAKMMRWGQSREEEEGGAGGGDGGGGGVVWCVEVVAGDGDDDRMGLLGESGASSRLAARSLFWLTPKRRSPARDEIVAGSLPFSARWTVSILILRVYVVDYCSVVGVLFFAGTESVFYLTV
jgi:hypothetical protein